MDTVKLLKQIDILAREANGLWHSLENLKETIAKEAGISEKRMKALNIFVREASHD